jgi:GTP pyrophosphokinase
MATTSPQNRNPDILFAGLLTQAKTAHPGFDVEPVRRAYEFSKEAHGYQLRRSGDPYITHLVEVGLILFELLEGRADETMISAAILHDVVEDTRATIEQVEERFGPDVALLVDGLTKISSIEMRDRLQDQASTLRKMLLSMARDLRVVLIKLADRLHNMRTLEFLPRERGMPIARETLDIYAPLAHRLGIATVKWELEDLAFKYLEPETYRQLVHKIATRREERERLVEEVKRRISQRMLPLGIKADVQGRPKHFHSIAKKMRDQGLPFEEIYDLLGVRIITTSKADCYRALGEVHELYPPVLDRIKDYIATPKPNGYQSLHTTVIGPGNHLVEVQIRTREMHLIAELGVAAHYAYKHGEQPETDASARWADLMRQTARWTEDASSPQEFLEDLKLGLYEDEVFVFTPRGDAIRLPKGSTPIDFAFTIHTQVGARTVGARVNGRIMPLRTQLENGDRVEIITSPHGKPNPDWLKIVKSSRARSKIRRYLKAQRQQQSAQLGKEILEKELRKRRRRFPSDDALGDLAQGMGFEEGEQLLAAIANGDVGVQRIIHRLYPPATPEPDAEESRRKLFGLDRIRQLTRPPDRGVSIQGLDNLMISFARCCMPVPGDRITGIITRGRGVRVHRLDCPNAFEGQIEPERRIDVEWNTSREQAFLAKLRVFAVERRGLLADVSKVLHQTETNIRNIEMGAEDALAQGTFFVEVRNLKHLERVIKAIRGVKGVTGVERVQSLSPSATEDAAGDERS